MNRFRDPITGEETHKNEVEILSDLAEICPGQEIKLTREDIKAIKYARDVLVSLNKSGSYGIIQNKINTLEDQKDEISNGNK